MAAVNAVGSAVAGTGLDADHDSLKSLMSNVTSDYNQVRQCARVCVSIGITQAPNSGFCCANASGARVSPLLS